MTDLTVASFFSGVGLLDLGLEWAGFRTVSFSEIDPYANRILALRYPDAPNLGDLHGITDVPPATLWAGDFPCQPVSVAGKRAAQDDERWLWPRWVELIRLFRPRYLLLENVSNLLAVNDGRAFGDVLGDLAASGYDAEWDCIPAAAVGAPHLRDRVWIVAYATGYGRPRSGPRDDRRMLGASGAEGVMEPARDGSSSGTVADPPSWRRHESPTARPGEYQGQRTGPAGGRGVAATLADADGPRGTAGVPEAGWHGQGHPEVADHRGDGGGVRWSAPPWRVGYRPGWWRTEPDVGRVAHGVPHRVDRLRCLGNGVVPQVAEFVGWRLRAMIEADALEAAA